VADESFSVSEKVKALYGQPKTLTADGGAQMAELRREMRRRMAGNDYCARPVELGCHVESIGESLHLLRDHRYFATTVESGPPLAQRGAEARVRWAGRLLSRLENEAS
jgi:hypothetical protein